MEDREFFDLLYQQWSKTTGAQDTYWMTEEDTEHYAGGPGTWNVFSVNKDGERKFIASFEREEDADFIAAMHGCLADLVRKLNDALDEADRADYDRDSRECRIAELELENAELRSKLNGE
ncbi:hypothetical protein SEA_KALNOKY_45 [Mycobacterium phage Kalnoky]|uniref:Uncharacterized protein n=1 Tax=Mycobacterium phage PurpleHaze TaxID=1983577 RepID=A0A220NRW0_9CAUD|nr:hypothetical protein KIJ57_gp49 [Mycobacterium phage Purple Haze]AXC35150.1 hypothetical protein SEA_PHRANNY_45 [Mycobacterium phage Phranny]AXH44091.1 hypothetical protein SEA_KALNOKY_45 [Mycobacterium phage Kalnoky]AXH44499.1 hypothetical protein SEA_MARIUS_45 [Mycobacterium phage Marius]AXH44670.1 hypothetical protein SEA_PHISHRPHRIENDS_42 [Mycobacterium phage PhishRPhriends]AXH44820.1 hypothetical protein SEA_REBA_44 [Mycobacterium phage Reba]AZF96813.1 hypothetical protein SEA_KALB97_